MDEIKLTQAQVAGSHAQQLLDSESFNKTVQYLRDEYIDAWQRTHLNDEKGRERLWQAVQLLGKIQDNLKKVAANGKLATRDLAAIKYLKR